MNSQERAQLSQFLQQLTQAQAGPKDAEAEALISEACARQPDAAYLLVQRALLLGQAVQAAQAQVEQTRAELEQLRAGSRGSFLSDPNAWGQSIRAGAAPAAPSFQAAPALPPAFAASSRGSGFLGSIATTAAGVVAGSFLFQGIEHLMGHHAAGGAAGLAGVSPLLGADESPAASAFAGGGLAGNGGLDALVPDSDLLDGIDAGDVI